MEAEVSSSSGFQKRRKALDLTQWQLAQRIEAARNTSITFLHGAVFLPREGMNSINLIVPAIANALDLKFEASSELSKHLLKLSWQNRSY